MDPRFAPSRRPSAVRFLTYTGEEIKKISCKQITNPNTLDSLLHPTLGGLYDPALGPSDKDERCGTCGLDYVSCPGHMGHIPLPLPVYHPVFFSILYQLLRSSCLNCHRLLCSPLKALVLRSQLELIDCGLLSDAAVLESELLSGEDDAAVDNIVQSIVQYVSRCKQKAPVSGGEHQRRTKNLVEFKRLLVTNFFKACMLSNAKCPHCSAPARKFRQESGIRVFVKALLKKQASSWVSARNKEIARIRQTMAETTVKVVGEEEEDGHTELGMMETNSKSSQQLKFVTTEECFQQSYLSPMDVREHFRELWNNDGVLMDALFRCTPRAAALREGEKGDASPADMFFLDVVPVPPSRFRPIARMGERRFENPQTTNLHKILNDCIAIHALMAEKEGEAQEEQRSKLSFSERLQVAWVRLQITVNCFMDSDNDTRNRDPPPGIKQLLEKKEGLFRKHMMGKRVDYAARSVISPDPYINMDEIGIPMVFATRLTYPQPVTHWNVKELRQAVINGPKVHPGATHVQSEDGSLVRLSFTDARQRSSIAKRLLTPSKESDHRGANKKVFRHLKNGDVLLLNRQPTLHKPSIMAHKARVLPGEKTLRLHYANCKSYNADFDGDEMNAHFPQNELARAEAYNIVATHHQYLVPKDGTPLSGLIQDHVVSGLLMTLRGRMFTRTDYMQLVFSALPQYKGYFKTLPPCIWKPERLWSGKQVVSTVLLNVSPEYQDKLNLTSKAKIAPKEWGRAALTLKEVSKKKKKKKKKPKYQDDIMTESEVVFRQGELLCGVLDKAQFGASKFGFVHSCYELYGGAVANLLLSALGRLFTTFFQFHGFTLGVEDILVTPEADAERRRVIVKARQCGQEAAAEAFGVDDPTDTALVQEKYEKAHHNRDDTGIKTLDFFMKKKNNHHNNLINTACVPAGLYKPFPHNCLQLMVQSGAKGSTVNCMQISCLLGQIELEGQRPPLMTSGRFLPSFLPYDTSPRAGGFVDGRFLTGIRPQEYFFHCMAGREGLVDTAVKTSRSGYLQRCLIKHLEGICINYDLTVRDSDGSVVQFLYGEDGLDIGKTRFLTEKQFPFLVDNYQALLYRLDPKSAVTCLETNKAAKHQRKLERWVHKHGPPGQQIRPYKTGFLDFYEKHLPEMLVKFPKERRDLNFNNRTKAQLELIDMWYGTSPMVRESCKKKRSHYPDPTNTHLSPDRHFGSIPEMVMDQINSFISKNGNMLGSEEESKVTPEKFQSVVQLKCLRALAEPGEAVGLLAAQSVGEPSTQMTLNTFHFAGRGEMNVTLGIPRLREILMTASANIKTPAMDVPLLPHPEAKQQGERLKKLFTRVSLSEVLEKVEVWETLAREGKGHRYHQYKVKLMFLPEQYLDDFLVTSSKILNYIENTFITKLRKAISREIKLIGEQRSHSVAVERESHQSGQQEDTEDGEVEGGEQLGPPKDDTEDLSDIEDEDADASTARQLSRKQEHMTYDEPDESDEEVMKEQRETEDEETEDEGRGPVSAESEEEEREDGTFIAKGEAPDLTEVRAQLDMDRVRDVIASSPSVVHYDYDPVNEQWCQITLRFPGNKVMITSVIEKIAPKAVVHEIPEIKKGFLVESSEPGEEGTWRLKTDGVNLQVLCQYADVLDLKKVYTNNIHAMANTYGIEAACKAIIKEISSVFKVYGIAVDYRHLSLIADYMTFEGSYKPFNRIGIEANSSPFQKMTFETTLHFLKAATIAGDTDSLASPSARLVAGRVVHGGTGCFELLQTLC